jgi:hypothetical protein
MKKVSKYIRYSSGFITFAEPIMHKEIRFDVEPISAGFYYITVFEGELIAKCYGDSVSLNLKGKPEDSELLTRQLNGQW